MSRFAGSPLRVEMNGRATTRALSAPAIAWTIATNCCGFLASSACMKESRSPDRLPGMKLSALTLPLCAPVTIGKLDPGPATYVTPHKHLTFAVVAYDKTTNLLPPQ